MKISTVAYPGQNQSNLFYPTNQPPLSPNPLVKLPLGSVKPRGWLKHQLDLMVDGMVGRLTELSGFLGPDNGWLDGESQGWEEQPYWLRGFYPLAALTGDQRSLNEANRWIEAVISSQEDDGYFGSQHHKHIHSKSGKNICDLWGHMVMIDALIQHHEFTGDERVPALLKNFFKFCQDLPVNRFMPRIDFQQSAVFREDFNDWHPEIQISRAGDMLPHIYWLYNQNQDPELLKLSTRFYQSIMPPVNEWLDKHIVHFTQRFSYFGLYGQQIDLEKQIAQSEYWYAQHMSTWGQQPRGIFAADEQIRPGKTDPRQGFETCGMTEFAKSFYLLGRISGSPLYADRCEDVMLNHFPPSQTPDLKALHYLTASNQPQLDATENHDYFNKGKQICYSPHIYRCCQHNVAMGWPWYVQNLWQGTADNGLAVWMYAASEVTAKVGEGQQVQIVEETDYPFEGNVQLSINCRQKTVFPLYLRIPAWCRDFRVTLNNSALDIGTQPQSYLRIEREWSDGDIITIEMAMEISLSEWPRTGSVSVNHGPLSYSVKIAEEWRQYGGTEEWPEWEVFPKSPWNYGLVKPDQDLGKSFQVSQKKTLDAQPWTVESAPVEIKTTAKRIPQWKLEENQTVQEVPRSPLSSDEPEETISFIPLGCARLRMACLPIVE